MTFSKKISAIALSCVTLGYLNAQAISRVGGGKVQSQSSGFELSVPSAFALIESMANEELRASGPPALTREFGLTKQFVQIAEFRNEFPQEVQSTKQELQSRLSQSGWTSSGDQTGCALTLRSARYNVAAFIVTWGAGKGFVLKGPSLPDVEKAMIEMIGSLQINPGACSWK